MRVPKVQKTNRSEASERNWKKIYSTRGSKVSTDTLEARFITNGKLIYEKINYFIRNRNLYYLRISNFIWLRFGEIGTANISVCRVREEVHMYRINLEYQKSRVEYKRNHSAYVWESEGITNQTVWLQIFKIEWL